MTIIRKLSVFAGMAVLAGTLAATPAAADPVLDQAKAQGMIGERYNGYLGIVDPASAPAELKRRVDENNAKRLALYTEMAKKSGASVDTVAALTAEKLIGKVGAGEFVQPGDGQPWVRK